MKPRFLTFCLNSKEPGLFGQLMIAMPQATEVGSKFITAASK